MFGLKIISQFMFLITNVFAGNHDDELSLVGGTRDINNCLVRAG